MIVQRCSIPPSPLDAGCHASDIFCIDEHNIAKQTAFVNHYAEMRFWWKAAFFLLSVVLLFNYFCISQPTVLKASFLVQLKCTNNRNLIAQLRIIIRIGMFTRKDKFKSL